ncbi:transcriptional regulator, BadM/Rrf2 family [Jannaschia faecimaris]|uniref:Transcriptional regulator, BadM/Rrf2 family n=1 Tax=Jannaschia faecimaris TaxID=1244108 RepID=A0A1H3R2Q7_9RHOB|nr:Rrf2 family transcriptional regulator [Jannaschia faecimaris]SDZ19793.1 transcriptional regulator, BadM/Rrf2 family [Jannaschia faecimaris]
MQLDKFTDYALRILMTLAVRSPERIATSEIATMFAVSENHLSKVATKLVREDFAISERGRSGGLILARSADSIIIGDVVRTMRRAEIVVECLGPNKTCRVLPACGLRPALVEAEEAFFAILDGYTLADITRSRQALAQLMSV